MVWKIESLATFWFSISSLSSNLGKRWQESESLKQQFSSNVHGYPPGFQIMSIGHCHIYRLNPSKAICLPDNPSKSKKHHRNIPFFSGIPLKKTTDGRRHCPSGCLQVEGAILRRGRLGRQPGSLHEGRRHTWDVTVEVCWTSMKLWNLSWQISFQSDNAVLHVRQLAPAPMILDMSPSQAAQSRQGEGNSYLGPVVHTIIGLRKWGEASKPENTDLKTI